MRIALILGIIVCLGSELNAQNQLYPVIKDYGAVEVVNFKVELPNPNQEYKLINELYFRQENKEELYGRLDYAARIMNAHVAGGVPQEKVKLAVVIFSGATPTILSNEAYKARFGVDNPNIELLDRMMQAGIEVIVCGQSMVKQEISPEQVHKGVIQAFSRITATSTLLNEGYSIF